MPRFQYHARDGRGDPIAGQIEASSQEEAGQKLRAEGKYVVNITPAVGVRSKARQQGNSGVYSPRVKRDDVISFTHQLAVMVDTGVPLKEALDCAVDQTESDNLRIVLRQVNESVQGGTDFSASLARFPKVFPSVMVALVQASEMSGTMGEMLERVAAYLTKEQQTRQKIKRALTYPCCMLGFAVVVTVFLMIFILPRFAAIYEGRGAALPGPTRFLMGCSDSLIHFWYLWILGVAVTIVGLFFFCDRKQAGALTDYVKLEAPVLGSMFSKLYLTRACNTMGTMTNSGVAVLDMVAAVRHVTDNVYYDELWNVVDDRLRKGDQLSEPLFESALIPRSVAQMVFSGEKSGRLGQVLNRIATFAEDDLDDAIKSATQFIEPVMIVCMGLLIGFIAMALLLPVFNAGRVMAG